MSPKFPLSGGHPTMGSNSQNQLKETTTLTLEQPLQAHSSAPLLGATLAELTAWVQQQGQPAYRGRQLHEWIYQKGVRSLTEISASDRTPF